MRFNDAFQMLKEMCFLIIRTNEMKNQKISRIVADIQTESPQMRYKQIKYANVLLEISSERPYERDEMDPRWI